MEREHRFWIQSSRLWDNRCSRHLNDLPTWPAGSPSAGEDKRLISDYKRAAPGSCLVAGKLNWRNGTAMTVVYTSLQGPVSTTTSLDCVTSRQSAALQRDKEQWTLCLRDWCLVLKHSWRTLFIWYIYDIWRCRPHYHHHLVAAVSVHSHLKHAVQIYFLCVYVLMHMLRNNYIYTHACLLHCRITNSLFALQLCVVSWRLKSPWTPDFKTEKLKVQKCKLFSRHF